MGWMMEVDGLVGFVEPTIPFETSFDCAVQRKETKTNEDIITSARSKGYQASPITLEVGPRGVLNPADFKRLKNSIPNLIEIFQLFSTPSFAKLLMALSRYR